MPDCVTARRILLLSVIVLKLVASASFTGPSCSLDQITVVDDNTGHATCKRCPMCLSGTGSTVDCQEARVSSSFNITCVPCTDGKTFNDGNTSYACQRCSPCQREETITTNCTAKQDRTCGDCIKGTYRDITGNCVYCDECCDPKVGIIEMKCKKDGLPPTRQCKTRYGRPCPIITTTIHPSPLITSFMTTSVFQSSTSESVTHKRAKSDIPLSHRPSPTQPAEATATAWHTTSNKTSEKIFCVGQENKSYGLFVLTFVFGLLVGAGAGAGAVVLAVSVRFKIALFTNWTATDVLCCNQRDGAGLDENVPLKILNQQTPSPVIGVGGIVSPSARTLQRHLPSAYQASDSTASEEGTYALEESTGSLVEDSETSSLISDTTSVNIPRGDTSVVISRIRHQSTSSQASENAAYQAEPTAAVENIPTVVDGPEARSYPSTSCTSGDLSKQVSGGEKEVLSASTESIFDMVKSFSSSEVESTIAVIKFIKELMQSKVENLPLKYRRNLGMKLMTPHPFGYDYRSFGDKIGLSNAEVKAIGESRKFEWEFIVEEFRRKTDGKIATLKEVLLESGRKDIVVDVIYKWLEDQKRSMKDLSSYER